MEVWDTYGFRPALPGLFCFAPIPGSRRFVPGVSLKLHDRGPARDELQDARDRRGTQTILEDRQPRLDRLGVPDLMADLGHLVLRHVDPVLDVRHTLGMPDVSFAPRSSGSRDMQLESGSVSGTVGGRPRPRRGATATGAGTTSGTAGAGIVRPCSQGVMRLSADATTDLPYSAASVPATVSRMVVPSRYGRVERVRTHSCVSRVDSPAAVHASRRRSSSGDVDSAKSLMHSPAFRESSNWRRQNGMPALTTSGGTSETVAHSRGMRHFERRCCLRRSSGRRCTARRLMPKFAGAFLGSLSVLATLGSADNLGATIPRNGYTLDAFLMEMGFTALLVASVFVLADHGEGRWRWRSLLPGMTVGLATLVIGPLTGSSLNPARTVAPAVLADAYGGLWVYLVAVPLGAFAVAAMWKRSTPHRTTPSIAKSR